MVLITRSEAETEDAGKRLIEAVKTPELIAIYGEMGAGKTAFVRGMGKMQSMPVNSPTYSIVNEYEGNPSIYHFDLYRLNSEEELFDIGWDDYIQRGGILVVEWSERAPDYLKDAIKVKIEKIDESRRKITIDGDDRIADFSL